MCNKKKVKPAQRSGKKIQKAVFSNLFDRLKVLNLEIAVREK